MPRRVIQFSVTGALIAAFIVVALTALGVIFFKDDAGASAVDGAAPSLEPQQRRVGPPGYALASLSPAYTTNGGLDPTAAFASHWTRDAARGTCSGWGIVAREDVAGATWPSAWAQRTVELRSDGQLAVTAAVDAEVRGQALFLLGDAGDFDNLSAVPGRPFATVPLPPAATDAQGVALLDLRGFATRQLPTAQSVASRAILLLIDVGGAPGLSCVDLELDWTAPPLASITAPVADPWHDWKAGVGPTPTPSANGHVDSDRLLPACTQSGNILEYVGPGGGSEPYDYECEEASAGGGGLAHLTFDGYELIAAAASPSPTAGQIQGQTGDPTGITVAYTSAHAADAAKILVGNRVRITQTTGATPRWYEGTVTKIARATDTYTYHFDASDDEDNDAVSDASTLLLPASAGYEVIRIGSGLDYARTTAPLTGNGKPGNAIGIDDATATARGAMSAADKAKLDGVEDGAEPNPDNVSLPFRTQNGATALPGEIVFYKSDNSEWQSGSSNDIAAIELDADQYTLQQNPGIDTATYTGWHSLPANLVEHRGSSVWTFQRIADSSPFADIAGTLLRIQAETIVKNNDGNFVLQNLTVLQGLDNTFGTGVNWTVVGAFTPPVGADALVGIVGKSRLPSDVVYTEELQGKATDRFASYNNAMVANSYRAGDWVLTTDTSGPPTSAAQVRQPDIATGSGLIVLGRLRTDADPNNLVWAAVPAATDLASGDIWYASIDGDRGSHLAITITSAGTLVGTGDAAYVWATATWVETGDIADVQDFGDYFRLGEHEPTQLQIEIPATDVLGAPWLLVDGTNATEATKDAIQGDNEESTLANTFRVDATNVAYYVSLNEPGGAQLNTAVIRLPSSAAGSKDDTDLQRLVKPAAWVEVGDYTIDVTSNYSRAIVGTSLTFTFNYVAVNGTKPSGSSPVKVRVVGEDVHRGQLARQAFAEETPSIAGKGGSSGQVWTRGSSDSNAGWADGPISHGTALPNSCGVPALFALTAVDGSNAIGLYVCLATNTWTNVGP